MTARRGGGTSYPPRLAWRVGSLTGEGDDPGPEVRSTSAAREASDRPHCDRPDRVGSSFPEGVQFSWLRSAYWSATSAVHWLKRLWRSARARAIITRTTAPPTCAELLAGSRSPRPGRPRDRLLLVGAPARTRAVAAKRPTARKEGDRTQEPRRWCQEAKPRGEPRTSGAKTTARRGFPRPASASGGPPGSKTCSRRAAPGAGLTQQPRPGCPRAGRSPRRPISALTSGRWSRAEPSVD